MCNKRWSLLNYGHNKHWNFWRWSETFRFGRTSCVCSFRYARNWCKLNGRKIFVVFCFLHSMGMPLGSQIVAIEKSMVTDTLERKLFRIWQRSLVEEIAAVVRLRSKTGSESGQWSVLDGLPFDFVLLQDVVCELESYTVPVYRCHSRVSVYCNIRFSLYMKRVYDNALTTGQSSPSFWHVQILYLCPLLWTVDY